MASTEHYYKCHAEAPPFQRHCSFSNHGNQIRLMSSQRIDQPFPEYPDMRAYDIEAKGNDFPTILSVPLEWARRLP